MASLAYKSSTKQLIWMHNSFFGHVAMTRANMRSIQQSQTATRKAKRLALAIDKLAIQLGNELKNREKVSGGSDKGK